MLRYYRLYRATADPHYAVLARQFLYDPRKAVDLHGSQGYGLSGLCTEALTLTPPRGHGVEMWLPWLTCSIIKPLARLEDTFGSMELPSARTGPLRELRAREAAYAATLGLQSVPRPAPGGAIRQKERDRDFPSKR